MAISNQKPPIAPPGPAKFIPGHFAILLSVCLLTAWLLGAWPAAQIGRHFAPLVLFPLLEGLALGAVTLLWLRNCNQGHRLATILGLLLIVLTFVSAQHYASFLAARAAAMQRQEQTASPAGAANSKQGFAAVAAQLAPPPPENLLQYLQEEAVRGRPLFRNVTAHGPWAWASWTFDALLVLLAAALLVVPALQQPYCNACHTWYRVVRAAPIPGNCEHALRSVCGFAEEHPFRWRRFALLSCSGGCGPDAVDLFRESNAKGPAPQQSRTWLSIAQRQAFTALLDQQTSSGGTDS